MGMLEALLYIDNAAATTTAHDRHINPDLFGFSTKYPDDYDATVTISDQFYKVQWRLTKPPTVKPHLTGLYEKDKQAKYLEKLLLSTGSNRAEVICIFGVGGGGKKKLALDVYQRIRGHFNYHMSVSVGPNPDMAKLIKNMIEQVYGEYIGASDADNVNQLTQRLNELLHKKRYLVVIDDICSTNDWETIESCFPKDDPHSRIIITTQFEDAAKAAGDHFYWIPVPVEADVESLFSKNKSEIPTSVLTRKLHGKEDASEQPVLQWKELEQMKQLTKVRYNSLPPSFRACLLYLSIFPEKHEVEIDRLVRLWLANGLIPGLDDLLMEETARSYINTLIARKLIEPSGHDYDGTVRSCTVHPLIHEFIVWQATKNQYVSFIHEEQGDSLPSVPNVRWLSLQNKSTKMAGNSATYLPDVRSVTTFGQASDISPLAELQRRLRVLDMERCEGPVCLDDLCKFVHLRYLGLRGTHVSELPERIGDLIYLQTLDVRSTKVQKLPTSIVGLENLMHLLAGDAELPSEISKMKALVTLSCASTMKSSATVGIQELSEIASLRELELFHARTQGSEDNSLPSTLENKGSDDQTQVIFLNDGFPSLKKLRIQCRFTAVNFKIGALPKVQVLELKFDNELPEEYIAVSGIQYIPRLEHVLLDFSHHGRGTEVTITAVRTATEIHPNDPKVFVLGYKSG